ncbi:MAG TPA: serine hydrolase, partial [Phototrophicaceae bacterium]|nr:serine hydrolase [Phototrophicaceae bacterium]
MMHRLPIWFFLCCGLALTAAPILAQTAPTPWPTEGWTTSTPEAQGLNSAKLAEMIENIVVTDLNIHSVLVVRNGALVLEAYRYPHTAETLHHIYSCTKSFTSALVGIAQEQGFISSIEQPLLDFFPERTVANLDEAKKSITIEHLLTMSSGLDWPGGILEPIMGDLRASDDWLQFVLDRPVSSNPGEQFLYNSGGSNLLAAIVETATGQPMLDFAEENLFKPLGITHLSWQTDPQGHYLGGWGLHLEPRDMAKFGYLYLNGGQWDGQQIIPAEWVATSTQKHISSQPLSDGYGYQWWVDHNGYYMALGYGGQYILVYPEKNLVVVFTSGLAPTSFSQPESFFERFILPAVEADTALPENPEGTAALEEAIESLAN